jgi:hypothetical protein
LFALTNRDETRIKIVIGRRSGKIGITTATRRMTGKVVARGGR